ncbi:hypothetical protein Bca52824_008460 [Brassica carinata]|uniref:RRM domain-containing protein n=1 Tax=Brassica carinata TaxID=52824 RepID=A0A8X8B8U4_BRACI|nr:hypothetical protein Bca52824_008460 [Brassica carinata]
MTTSDNVIGCFGDTKLTKVFVGGLAWDTQKKQCMIISSSMVISWRQLSSPTNLLAVTFKEAEAAKRACEDSTPIINGRRANCNLASLGGRHSRPPTMPSPQGAMSGHVGNNQAQWYYPAGFTHQQQRHHQAFPFYGYPSSYVAPNMTFNQKVGYVGGTYMNGYYAQPQPPLPRQPQYHQHHMYGGGRNGCGKPDDDAFLRCLSLSSISGHRFPSAFFTKHIPTHPISVVI